MRINLKVKESLVCGIKIDCDSKRGPDRNGFYNFGFDECRTRPNGFIPIDDRLMLRKTVVELELDESGGCRQDGSGMAEVVCGLSGRKLKPFLIKPEKGFARFGVKGCCVRLRAFPNNVIVIEKINIEEEVDGVLLNMKIIYSGDFDVFVDRNHSRYINAAFAVRSKAVCLHCNHIHYAKDVDGLI